VATRLFHTGRPHTFVTTLRVAKTRRRPRYALRSITAETPVPTKTTVAIHSMGSVQQLAFRVPLLLPHLLLLLKSAYRVMSLHQTIDTAIRAVDDNQAS
jgi:hypothetical protein